MSSSLVLSGLALVAVAAWLWQRRAQAARRAALRSLELPAPWLAVLERRVALYRALPASLREPLHGLIRVFLDEKVFIGCDGLEITDEMRLIIAAQACLLLLNRKVACYPGFTSILVYPDTYIAAEIHHDGEVESLAEDVREGESWEDGPVVLSWAEVLHGARQAADGRNVVLHEFAHKLDEENDLAEGLPVLSDPAQYASWEQVLGREYAALQQAAARGQETVMDDYGAESPAEFFAVGTETFFEKPVQLKARHPALYEEFRKFYRLDPSAWHGLAGRL